MLGNIELNYSPGEKYLLYRFAIVSAPPSPVTINERGILNLIPCENKGNRTHVVNKELNFSEFKQQCLFRYKVEGLNE